MQYKAKGDTDSQVSLRVGFTSTEGFRRTLGLNTRTCRGHGRRVQAARRNEWAHLPFPLPLTCKHDPAPYPLSPYPPSLPSLLTLSLPTLSLPTLTLPALSITCKHEPCSQPELGEELPTLALQQVSAAMQSARHSSRMVAGWACCSAGVRVAVRLSVQVRLAVRLDEQLSLYHRLGLSASQARPCVQRHAN